MKNHLHAILISMAFAILSTGFAYGQQSFNNFSKLANQGNQIDLPENPIPQNPKGYNWFEGFDGGALPDGWQNIVNEGNGWDFALNPYSHTYIYYFGDLQRNAMLVTPLLDLSGLEQVTLGIFHRIYAYSEGWSHKILMSDDGANWDVVAEFTEGFNPDENQYMEFDITPAKSAGQVYLAFAVDYPFLPDYYEVVWEIVDITVFEPVETYNVSFVVEDENGNPLNDAVITLNNITNAAGDYIFEDVEVGTYDYSVALDEYITEEGQLEVVDQDVEKTVVLKSGQYVDLVEGWSLISSYINPENPMVESIFADQMQNESIVFMFNLEGIFWPGYNINTMGDWDSYLGYKVKMGASDIVEIHGTMVEDQNVALHEGINYLPVLSKESVSADDIFGQVAGDFKYAIDLFDELIYWPEGEIYTLEDLIPGRAYIVRMAAEGIVSYADIDGVAKINAGNDAIYPSGIPQFNKTGSTHLISISKTALENTLETGDFIAAFNDQNQCVGAVQYLGASDNLGLIVYGDDQTTDIKDGLSSGEEIVLHCIKSVSQTIIDINPVWNLAMPNTGYFNENGLSAISEIKLSTLNSNPVDFGAVNIYPNPAKDIINFNLQRTESATVEILNNIGQVVWKSEINKDQNSCNISHLGSGVYLIKISAQHNILLISKLIIE